MNMKKLRVSHLPQMQCEPFIVDVKDIQEAKKIFDFLADYDLFQYENKIKPDYASATFLEEWDEESQEWIGWSDEETGIDDLDEYFDFIAENE